MYQDTRLVLWGTSPFKFSRFCIIAGYGPGFKNETGNSGQRAGGKIWMEKQMSAKGKQAETAAKMRQ
jgi:hypothetical protein